MYNHIVRKSYVKDGKGWMWTGTIKGLDAKNALVADYIARGLKMSHITRMSTHFKSVTHTVVTVYYDNGVKAVYSEIDD